MTPSSELNGSQHGKYHKQKFSNTLPTEERAFLSSKDKKFKQKYYVYVTTARAKGETIMMPSEFYDKTQSHGFTPFTVIAEKLGLPLTQVKSAYASGMQKLQQAVALNY